MASGLANGGHSASDENHAARALQIELRDDLVETFERVVARRKLARLDAAIHEARRTGSGLVIAWSSSRSTFLSTAPHDGSHGRGSPP